MRLPGRFIPIVLLASIVTSSSDSRAAGFASVSDPKAGHLLDFDVTAGFPSLIAAEIRIVSVPGFEFGVGVGAAPINGIAQSLYKFSAVPLDLQTGDTYNLYPSGTYSLSGFYALARWFPWTRGFFINLSVHSLSFSASINGSLKDETLGTTVSGAVSASVGIAQPAVDFGPGYQFIIGDHFHIDLGAGLLYLLPATASTSVGGSLSNFAVLNAAASASYTAAKDNLVNSVNQAMTDYRNSLKFAPSIYFSLGYIL